MISAESPTSVATQGVPVYFAVKRGVGAQGLEFRAEKERAALKGIVERLDAQAVAHQMQRLLLPVPQRNGKHAHKSLHRRFQAISLDPGQHDFGIGVAAEGRRAPGPL